MNDPTVWIFGIAALLVLIGLAMAWRDRHGLRQREKMLADEAREAKRLADNKRAAQERGREANLAFVRRRDEWQQRNTGLRETYYSTLPPVTPSAPQRQTTAWRQTHYPQQATMRRQADYPRQSSTDYHHTTIYPMYYSSSGGGHDSGSHKTDNSSGYSSSSSSDSSSSSSDGGSSGGGDSGGL